MNISNEFLTTQMEPIAARLVLPCVDEPDVKSKFKVRIHTDRTLDVLSNMPESCVSTIV